MPEITPATETLTPEWVRVFDALAEDEGVTAFLGTNDAGKSTCARAAAEHLIRRGRIPLAVVDADVGQASIGPPATIGLSLLNRRSIPAGALPVHALQFIGSVSPAGYLLQTIAGTKRLVDQARAEGAKTILVDTSGLVAQNLGFHLKLNKLELLTPRHIVALQRKDELEMLLSVLSARPGVAIHRLSTSHAVRERSPAERYRYRVERFAEYFSVAESATLHAQKMLILAPAARYSKFLSGSVPPVLSLDLLPQSVIGTLIGINDASNRTLGLGIIQNVNAQSQELTVLTPVTVFRDVRIIQLGNVRLAPGGEDLDRMPAGSKSVF